MLYSFEINVCTSVSLHKKMLSFHTDKLFVAINLLFFAMIGWYIEMCCALPKTINYRYLMPFIIRYNKADIIVKYLRNACKMYKDILSATFVEHCRNDPMYINIKCSILDLFWIRIIKYCILAYQITISFAKHSLHFCWCSKNTSKQDKLGSEQSNIEIIPIC